MGDLETDGDEAATPARRRARDRRPTRRRRGWWPSSTLVGWASETAGTPEEAFAAWRRFFEALAEERPLVLVFEDLHWADDDLLDFIEHLADWVRTSRC